VRLQLKTYRRKQQSRGGYKTERAETWKKKKCDSKHQLKAWQESCNNYTQ
jgi:hypothetical protein